MNSKVRAPTQTQTHRRDRRHYYSVFAGSKYIKANSNSLRTIKILIANDCVINRCATLYGDALELLVGHWICGFESWLDTSDIEKTAYTCVPP